PVARRRRSVRRRSARRRVGARAGERYANELRALRRDVSGDVHEIRLLFIHREHLSLEVLVLLWGVSLPGEVLLRGPHPLLGGLGAHGVTLYLLLILPRRSKPAPSSPSLAARSSPGSGPAARGREVGEQRLELRRIEGLERLAARGGELDP